MEQLIEKIKSAIDNKKLFNRNDRVLVCVSGGPDSVFLLRLLLRLKHTYNLRMYVAHLNHRLRGAESAGDEAFVRSLCREFELPFFRCGVDTKKAARSEKLSIEEAARKLRYTFFSNICRVHGIEKVVLGHNKDDQVETVLMRLMRGTGITGLCGMRMASAYEDLLLIRPLLETSRKKITAYLTKHHIKSRTDSSNLKAEYFRNKIRIKILPFLEKYSPGFKENIFHLSENSKQAEEYLEKKVKPVFNRIVMKKDNNTWRLERYPFFNLPFVLRSRILRRIIGDLKGNLTGIESKHIRIADDFIAGGIASGKYLDLPKSIQLRKARDHVDFQDKGARVPTEPAAISRILPIGREIAIRELNLFFKAAVVKGKFNLKNHSKMLEYFDLDRLRFPLKVRTRKKGDVFHPLGAGGRKKLKKFFIDEKVDDSIKNSIPVVTSGSKIIWVVGMRIAEDCRVTGKTERVLKIQAEKIE